MGKIYKRGATYWGRYTDSTGAPRRESLNTKDQAVAKARLRERELATPASEAASTTLHDALKHLLEVTYAGRNVHTLESYALKGRHLIRLLGADVAIGALDRARLQKYRADRIKEGAAQTTVHKEFVVLRRALAEQGVTNVVPSTKGLSTPKTRYLTPAEYAAVLQQLPEKRRAWFALACFLGLRDSELAGLTWADVDLDAGWITVRGTKTAGAFRTVPIGATVRLRLLSIKPEPATGPVLAPWASRHRDLCVAYWKATGRPVPKPGEPWAGLPRLSPNDLRRTFASWLKQRGADSKVVADLLGHASTHMVDRVYGKLAPKNYVDAVALLPCTENVRQPSPKQSEKGHSEPEDAS
jgi:integrase